MVVTLSSESNTLTGNTSVSNSAAGFFISGSSFRNSLTGNVARGNTTYGIQLSADSNTVINNILSGNLTHGIQVDNSSNIISSNKIYDNGSTGANDGIRLLATSSNTTLANNDITDTAGTGYAINILAGSTGNVLSGNRYSGTGAASINDAGTGTIYNAQQDASGNIKLSGSAVQTAVNSTTAFQVQNASAAPIFVVDTSTTSNMLTNPGFEVDTSTGWSYTSATGTRNTTAGQAYHGVASNTVNVSVAAGKATTTGFSSATVNATQYYFSFYAMKGTTTGTLSVSIVGGGAPACTLINYVALSTNGFNRYTCTFTPTGAITSISINDSATGTYYLDGVELNAGTSATAYAAEGAIQLRGTVNSPVTFLNTSNSVNALQVLNSSSVNALNVDTLNNQINIGSTATDTTAVLLTLDSYSTAADPTGVAGAMYYNSNQARFRCYENGAWRNCTGVKINGMSTTTQTPTAGTDTYIPGSAISLPSYGLTAPTAVGTATLITWRLYLTKTGGTVGSTFSLRVGPNGTTGDTLRCTAFSTGTGTAVTDGATLIVTALATAGGANAALSCSFTLIHSGAVGFSTAGAVQAYSTQAAFDSTPAGTKMGLSVNAGTSNGLVIQKVEVTADNL
jgi:parallel beta-helix repeat protein